MASPSPEDVYAPPLPESCNDNPGVACYDTSVSGDNLVTSLVIDLLIGLLCYFGFVLWRGSFAVYHGREFLPGKFKRPPKLKLGGHWQLWSWLIPSWTVSDKEFLESAGLDAYVAIRVLVFGFILFIPITILGVGVVLPVNYTGNYLANQMGPNGDTSSSNLTYVFQRMTITNIENGSSALWVHFAFLFVFVLWTCFLIMVFYEEHIALQQLIMKKRIDGHNLLEGEMDDNTSTPAALEENPTPSSTTTTVDTTTASASGNIADQETVEEGKATKEKQGEYDLWPVFRPESATPSRPRRAGFYAVLVMDEPARKYEVTRLKSMLGYGKNSDGTTKNSLKQWQDETSNTAAAGAGGDASPSRFYLPTDGAAKDQTNSNGSKTGGSQSAAIIPTIEQLEAGIAATKDQTSNNTKVVGDGDETSSVAQDEVFGQTAAGVWQGAVDLIKQSKADDKESQTSAKLSREQVVSETFKRLFGDDFDKIVPIYPTKAMDQKLMDLYNCQAKVNRVNFAINEAKEKGKQARVEKLQKQLQTLEAKEAALQEAAAACRDETFGNKEHQCNSFFAVFHTAEAAAMAADLNVNPLAWRGFHILPAPDPENTNFPTIQRSSWSRSIRRILTLPFILFIMLLPIGLISGIFSQLDAALCGAAPGDTGSLSGTWFCSDNFWGSLLRNIITGLLPSVLMSVYQMVVLPVYMMACAQSESCSVSLSGLDLRCGQLFFHWNLWNFFIGALLGGTVLNGLREAINNPGGIFGILGSALPASSNFFINYTMYRALSMTMFRLFYPHACIAADIAKWFRVLPRPKTEMDFARQNPLRNCRYSRDIVVAVMSIYICSLSFAVISPYILPWASLYFFLMYFVWRYQQLYVYQPAYSLDGAMWKLVAHRIVACLAVMVLFTGAMLIVKHGYIQGGVAILVLEPFLIYFNNFLTSRYDSVYSSIPVAVLEAFPRADLDPQLWIPTPLRPKAEGWFLEWGKAWQFWGAPRYGI